MRKPAFCICENKDADQLRGNREAGQRLCFPYTDSTIPLLPISEISSLYPPSVAVQPGLFRTWSETPKTGFLTTRLNSFIGAYHIVSSLGKFCFSVQEAFVHHEPEIELDIFSSVVASFDRKKELKIYTYCKLAFTSFIWI